MIKLDYDELKDLAKNQLCAEHQTPLVIVWHQTEGCYTLRCGEGHYPDALVRNLSLSELNRTGQLSSGPIKDNIERREKHKIMSETKSTREGQFQLIRQTDLGSGQLLMPDEVKALVEYAYKYHLDPYRGHVVLMYGQPYIGLDGYLFHANRSGKRYQLNSWPMTSMEKEQYQVNEHDHGWIAQVSLLDTDESFTGVGVITQEERTELSKKTPGQLRYPIVASKPWQMAQKRAEWQALRRAFPIGESEPKEGE